MITTAQEYNDNLWRINDPNIRVQALRIPKEESVFQINLNTRLIEAPEFLSVKTDLDAETIYFICDRFYDEIDLTTVHCAIYYKNAEGKVGTYPVPFYDITTFSGYSPYLIINLYDYNYIKGKYYIRLEDGSYQLAENDFDPNEVYYNYDPNPKHFVKAYVNYANYQPNVYFIKSENSEFGYVKATGGYDSKAEYYSYMDCPKILFPWVVSGRATAADGILQFMIQFYRYIPEEGTDDMDSVQWTYRLNTQIAKTKILNTLTVTKAEADEEVDNLIDIIPGWVADITGKVNDLYFGTEDGGYALYWIEA